MDQQTDISSLPEVCSIGPLTALSFWSSSSTALHEPEFEAAGA
jgi:hypothetical protein